MGEKGKGSDAEITLDDVLIAIKVLERFMRYAEHARRLTARIAPHAYSDPRLALLEKMIVAQRRGAEEEAEEEELTEEDIERLRRIASKLK